VLSGILRSIFEKASLVFTSVASFATSFFSSEFVSSVLTSFTGL
jgi:hypothetical protein